MLGASITSIHVFINFGSLGLKFPSPFAHFAFSLNSLLMNRSDPILQTKQRKHVPVTSP